MNVLQVDVSDLQGRRFNGYDLSLSLQDRGFGGAHVALRKKSLDSRVIPLLRDEGDEDLQFRIERVERRHSMNNVLYPWGRVLAQLPVFSEADVVHYHNIHWGLVSLPDMPWLFSQKPSVWTFHDPWPITGRCLHPIRCENWLVGCRDCPILDAPFPMDTDCAYQMWRLKRDVFSRIDPHVIVASDFMRDLVARSPLTGHLKSVHLIPFGIDTTLFRPLDRVSARRLLGIPDDGPVLFFRATDWPLKGLSFIREALSLRPPSTHTTLVTVEQRGLIRDLGDRYRLREFGRIDSDAMMPLLFAASDMLLMPSTAESFGMMALEAMACSRPVVCFDDTAVATVTQAPDCGLAVPWGDATALRDAIDRLVRDPDERRERGELGRSIAENRYSQQRYLDSMAALYGHVGCR